MKVNGLNLPPSPPALNRTAHAGQCLFGPVDREALEKSLEEYNVDSLYSAIKSNESLLRTECSGPFTNPVNRAFAWMELIEFRIEQDDIEGARSFLNEAREKNIFNPEEKMFQLPGDAQKILKFLTRIENLFYQDAENYFSPLIEAYENELREDSEGEQSPDLELEGVLQMEALSSSGRIEKRGWQRI